MDWSCISYWYYLDKIDSEILMKSSITEYIIAVFELFEAEVEAFKKSLINLFMTMIMIVTVLFLFLLSFVFLALGIYDFYLTLMISYLAGLATAASIMMLGLLILGFVKWRR